MKDENENLEVIETRIIKLQNNIMQRFDLAVSDSIKDWDRYNKDHLEKINETRKALLKELDDRLALIKQFPSVLDADKVDVFELTESGSKEIRDNWGRCKMRLDEGNWKIIILAKKVG